MTRHAPSLAELAVRSSVEERADAWPRVRILPQEVMAAIEDLGARRRRSRWRARAHWQAARGRRSGRRPRASGATDLSQPGPSVVMPPAPRAGGEAAGAALGRPAARASPASVVRESDITSFRSRVDELDHPCERDLRLEREDLGAAAPRRRPRRRSRCTRENQVRHARPRRRIASSWATMPQRTPRLAQIGASRDDRRARARRPRSLPLPAARSDRPRWVAAPSPRWS